MQYLSHLNYGNYKLLIKSNFQKDLQPHHIEKTISVQSPNLSYVKTDQYLGG